jgi:outer membrane lipoprotein LolB
MHSLKIAGRLLILATVSATVACTGPATKADAISAPPSLNAIHLKQLEQISSFTLQGRIGIQTNPKGFSGSLIWQHATSKDEIALYSPLGSQVASIFSSPTHITLLDSNGKSYQAIDAETLTQDVLGWRLPLKGLSDWALGRPSASPIEHSTWNAQGQLTLLKQDGWTIEFDNYLQQGNHTLPSKIYLKSTQLNLKLLVERWQLPPSVL